jgi:hypothetical protein
LKLLWLLPHDIISWNERDLSHIAGYSSSSLHILQAREMEPKEEPAFHFDLSASFAQDLALTNKLHSSGRFSHHPGYVAPRHISKTKASKKPGKVKLILLESTDVATDDAEILDGKCQRKSASLLGLPFCHTMLRRQFSRR